MAVEREVHVLKMFATQMTWILNVSCNIDRIEWIGHVGNVQAKNRVFGTEIIMALTFNQTRNCLHGNVGTMLYYGVKTQVRSSYRSPMG